MAAVTAERISAALKTEVFGRSVEHYPVSVSVSSVAQSWLRQRDAPHGALVVADTEIAPRGRLGQNWKTVDGISAAVVVRPRLGAAAEDLLWLAALVAACDSYRAGGDEVNAWWPDVLMLGDRQVGLVTVDTQLGPGVVVASVIAFQLDLPTLVPSEHDRVDHLAALMAALEGVFAEPLEEVTGRFESVNGFQELRVVVKLKPLGSITGVSAGIDPLGRLLIKARNQRLEAVTVDQIVSVELDPR